jgi:hypothetical protein
VLFEDNFEVSHTLKEIIISEEENVNSKKRPYNLEVILLDINFKKLQRLIPWDP